MTDNSNSDSDDTESEMRPLGAARTVPTALDELDSFVASANPRGKPAKTLLSSVKTDAQRWHTLMDNQQWRELSAAVGGVLKRMRNPKTRASSPTLCC